MSWVVLNRLLELLITILQVASTGFGAVQTRTIWEEYSHDGNPVSGISKSGPSCPSWTQA